MTFRQAQLSDASSIAAISIEVWVGTYLRDGVSPFFADYVFETFTVSAMEAMINDPADYILVSENSVGIDGFIRVSQNSAAPIAGLSDTEIATFYVQPRHHGKGIGKKLLQVALAHCRAMKVGTVWLATNAENTPAIRFYLAQGFEHVGETQFRSADQAYLNNVYACQIK